VEDDDNLYHPGEAGEAPEFVSAVPRLYDDLDCLEQLFQPEHPPIRIWGSDSESMTSNYRELLNLVMALEHGIASGSLLHSEVFVFTDNSTAEGCFYKGNSPSRTLCSLILQLCMLEMSGQIRLHITHVAGTSMIHQGTDGLSRGNYSSGFMAGESMLTFVTLHLGALDRSPSLLPWLQTWIPSVTPIRPLTPEEWFTRGHGTLGGQYDPGGQWHPTPTEEQWFLWAPDPAAAGAAVEELALSRLKRPHNLHVFTCLHLFTHHWRKQLFKVADLVIELPPSPRTEWSADMHEPLLLGLTLPLLSSPPWSLRNANRVLELGREVRRLWDVPGQDVGRILCKLCQLAPSLASLPKDVVWTMLYSTPSG
jgi:hypothetical protein